MNEQNERVLCIPRYVFDGFGAFQGVTTDKSYLGMLQNPELCFMPRSSVENDFGYKQIIPYVVVMRPSGKILSYIRSKRSGEQRLVGKRSIGIGGHINESDCGIDRMTGQFDWRTIYITGSERELSEELNIASNNLTNQIVGFINDDSNDVGKVHVGVIHRLIIPSPGGVSSDDPAVALEGFFKPFDIATTVDAYQLESWSKTILTDAEFLAELIRGNDAVDFPFGEGAVCGTAVPAGAGDVCVE